ncbi:hypothetical protein K474DRAFT_435836 [Panus rudis PR-1116 ss-1]|nr:hypothetical protein K474DRAFT_435836 [Panus rudis PR-1116 ss-1]
MTWKNDLDNRVALFSCFSLTEPHVSPPEPGDLCFLFVVPAYFMTVVPDPLSLWMSCLFTTYNCRARSRGSTALCTVQRSYCILLRNLT